MTDRQEPGSARRAPAPSASLAARLRDATRALHTRAERAGVMPALLRGELDAVRYARLMRSLHAIYVALEAALDRHAAHPLIAPLALSTLRRADAIADDLDALRRAGTVDPTRALPRAARGYVERLGEVAAERPERLVAHAYVRYLGDLSGGQMLASIVARTYPPGAAGTRFYDFGPPERVRGHAQALRAALDALDVDADVAQAIVDEAGDAFARHVRLFEEIAAGPTHAD